MVFNSIDFAVFFPVVFILYWFVFRDSLKTQNAFLLATSYFFYGWWDWRFLGLILISCITDYYTGLALQRTDDRRRRKLLLWTSIFINLGMLAYFKYSNFFIENFNAAFTLFGSEIQLGSLQLVLPIGISFYTFQTMSYTIDVYHRRIKPEKDMVRFFTFVSFFPQLVAGPIERAKNLLPQFQKARVFELSQAKDGIREILWGLFLKCVIADQASIYVNDIFTNYGNYPSGTIFLGVVYFGIQVYGDFAGYSSVAIGVARLMGFKLMRNFAYPYTAASFSEVWRRWHISLMSWFRDYVYKPLGGARKGRVRTVINIYIVFILSGLWHGAAWTFVLWGIFTATLIVFDYLKALFGWQYILDFKFIPFSGLRKLILIVYLISINSLACVFFRAHNIGHAFDIFSHLASPSLLSFTPRHSYFMIYVVGLILWEYWMRHRKNRHGLAIAAIATPYRWVIYGFFALQFLYFFNIGQQYIYFQF